MSWHANPWTTLQLLIVVGGAAFFAYLGADDFGPKDFIGSFTTAVTAFGAGRLLSGGQS